MLGESYFTLATEHKEAIIHVKRFFYLVNLLFFFIAHVCACVYPLYLKNYSGIACPPAIAIVILSFMTFPRYEGRFPYRENDFRNIGYSLFLSLSFLCMRCRRIDIKSAQHRDCARAIVPPAADRNDCEMSAAFKANQLFFPVFFSPLLFFFFFPLCIPCDPTDTHDFALQNLRKLLVSSFFLSLFLSLKS